MKYKWVFLGFSTLLVLVSIVGLFVYGLKPGIDFTGGTQWSVAFDSAVERGELESFLRTTSGLTDATVVQEDGANVFLIRAKELSEETHQEVLGAVQKEFGALSELSFQSIGAVVGNELVRKALWAFAINLFAIALYVAYAFRKVSRPVSSWKYALVTLITLFHDAIIPIGLFAFLGHYVGVEIDTNLIVAILVVIGFSVHDTIVVFDRIRENIRTGNVSKEGFEPLVNRSINETIARSVNTSLTLIFVLVTLFFLGAVSLKYFVLAILVGAIAGTYSSIFVASPLLVVWQAKKVQ